MEKKKLWIFVAIAYGVSALMSIFLILGRSRGVDTSVLIQTQMMYPLCGVILGKLICRKEGEKLPIAGYITALVITMLMMVVSVLSVFVPLDPFTVNGQEIPAWSLYSEYVIYLGSIVAYILFWICGKEKRKNSGMSHKNIKWSVVLVALFVVLYFGYLFISGYCTALVEHSNEDMDLLIKATSSPEKWIGLVTALPLTFFLSWLMFLGEEYGWRYYLQPLLQNKFGKRKGILILGLVWGLWHINIDFLYYTVEDGPQKFCQQIIVCIALGIFFGYAYMKTENIWVTVIMHFLNNNVGVLLLSDGGTGVFQNQHVSWSSLPITVVSMVIYMLFILAPIYSSDEKIANGVPNTYNC